MSGESSANDVERSDHLLLQRFREGQQDAATALYLKYGKRLQSLARAKTSNQLASRFDPEDVVQSVFRTFFRRAANGLYDVPEGDELWQLLLVIALNKIRDLALHHSAQKRDIHRTEGIHAQFNGGPGQADQNSADVLQVVLKDFMESLPSKQSDVARLRMQGYQVEEIAKMTQQSKRTVERVLNRLRQTLMDRLGFDE